MDILQCEISSLMFPFLYVSLTALIFFFMCKGILFAYKYAMYIQCPQRPERASDPLELELQVFVTSHHVYVRNWVWVLWQSGQCS